MSHFFAFSVFHPPSSEIWLCIDLYMHTISRLMSIQFMSVIQTKLLLTRVICRWHWYNWKSTLYCYDNELVGNWRFAVFLLIKNPPFLVIGADTVVTMDDVIYEKPRSKQDAFHMLSKSVVQNMSYFMIILDYRMKDLYRLSCWSYNKL